MSYHNLRVELAPPLATITLNRPHRRNALSLEMMEELLAGLEEVAAQKEVRAVILAAAGTVFSSGHDLSEMIGRELDSYRRIFDVCTEMMLRLKSIPQPVIAQVQGVATAAGCQLVAACDLAVASEQARFSTPGVKIGLFCTTPMVEVSRAVGRKRALEMLLTGQVIDARTACEWGLVNRVVPADQLAAETRQLACDISQASPYTIALGKQAYYAQIDLDQTQAYAQSKEVMSRNAMAADAQEGMSAFLEKRPPRWSGR
jgi:enoyl-CoA hydratase/carnithine racemase